VLNVKLKPGNVINLIKSLLLGSVLTAMTAAAHAATISGGFAANNGLNGNAFDIQIGPQDITLTDVDLAFSVSGTADVQFWIRPGSYVGTLDSSTGWTLADSITGLLSPGRNDPVAWDVADQVSSAGQTYGLFFLRTSGNSLRGYQNGSGAIGDAWVSNADISIFQGQGVGTPGFGGSLFSPRNFSGSLTYDVAPMSAVPIPASLPLLAGAMGLFGLWRRRRAA